MQLLPHYHHLHYHHPSPSIPSLVDRRDDILESEQPPHKRLHLSTLGSRYEIGESSTARPARGQGIDYGFVSTVDAAEAVPEIAPMTVGKVNTRVTELAELHKWDTQDLYALLEDAQDSRRQYGWWRRRLMLPERLVCLYGGAAGQLVCFTRGCSGW
ncbi:hypothetical protein Tco_0264269 [Tanacetum coccineum]